MRLYGANTEPHKAENSTLQENRTGVRTGIRQNATDNEIADKMRVPVGLLPELKIQMQGVASLDTTLADDYSLTLSDTIQADFSLEDETIKCMPNTLKANYGALWNILQAIERII